MGVHSATVHYELKTTLYAMKINKKCREEAENAAQTHVNRKLSH